MIASDERSGTRDGVEAICCVEALFSLASGEERRKDLARSDRRLWGSLSVSVGVYRSGLTSVVTRLPASKLSDWRFTM